MRTTATRRAHARLPTYVVALVAGGACSGEDVANPLPTITLEMGYREDGTATPLWTDGIAVAIGRDVAESHARTPRTLTPEAEAWVDVLREALPLVPARVGTLATTFGLPAPDAVVVAGDRGSSDGFGWVPDHIGINVEAFVEAYGPPDEGAIDRMVRLVAHEYIHLATYAYYPNHRDLRDTPFNRALWTMFFEGVGDYVSVSSRWIPDESGDYTGVTASTLERLEPIFVERLEALATAGPEAEDSLRAGISMGRFDRKWGSLPVALWLHTEAKRCGEAETLREMIRRNRDGVLPLAARHAAPPLRARIRALRERRGGRVGGDEDAPC